MIAFTICARNFLAQAHVLFDSLSSFHPDVPFYVVIADSTDGMDLNTLPFSVLSLDELGIPDQAGMADRYNITEFNTAMKPFAFLTLLDRHPGASVMYLDPDILVVSRFTELIELLEGGTECVLTPHLTEPAEHGEFRDELTLQFGIYNLGFCAMRDSEEVRRTLWWWCRRVEFDCVIDVGRGLFVDQKWADLFPAYIGNTTVLRHPGYNVAYWNLHQRIVRHGTHGWLVNDAPLRFVHFSGVPIRDTSFFSSHSQLTPASLRDFNDILADYRGRVSARGYDYFSAFDYAFGWNGESGDNAHTPQPPASTRDRGLGSTVPYLSVEHWTDEGGYQAGLLSREAVHEERRKIELASIPVGDVFRLPGYCVVCASRTEFIVSYMYADAELVDGKRVPNWREHLACATCRLVDRVRAAYHLLLQEADLTRTDVVFSTEAVTPFFRILKARHPAVLGSEYLGATIAPGASVDGIRHEDVQALSFADGALDVIVSLDVLEHVADHQVALREFARCLRTGGRLLLTAPFEVGWRETQVRATMGEGGVIRHLLPPEFHGNPVDERGSLAFRKFGWSILSSFQEAGFASAQVLTYWSDEFKYFGDPQVAFLAKK